MINLERMRIQHLIITLFLVVLTTVSGMATHLRAGEITVRRESCTSLTFLITITVYTNTGSQIKFGEPGLLDFGDGSQPLMPPTIDNTLRPDLGPAIGTVSFTTSHTYAGPGRYVISYNEPNRNAGILNMFNSVETKFYLETVISIDPFLGCDNSPRLLVPPIDKACRGAAFYHNPGAYDPDGDSLSYEFTIPKREKGIEVNNYRNPNAKEFYDKIGVNYSTANENGNGPPGFTINPVTGTIIWDAPGQAGEYNIAFIIKEWRKTNGVWINLGYVTRDMQIIVEDCKNRRPELQVPPDICVVAGTKVSADIFGTDADFDSVKIEAFSQILNQNVIPAFVGPATYVPNPPKYQATGPSKIAKLSLTWNTQCIHVKEQPYQVVFKITDFPKNGPKLVQFKTWNIRVVGPAPKWKDAVVPPNKRTANLEWNPYACNNAQTMEVWRRVDHIAYTPPPCVTGIPDFLGFVKIAEVPIAQSKYTDTNGGKGLAVGAQYCYRLVAVFPLPSGGSSYVSRDTCLAPIKVNAPIITNVTIDQTDQKAGQITVKWRSPYEINKAQFPPPFHYKVIRAVGFTGTSAATTPHPGTLTDTTYVDTGLNTTENVYNYRIALYDNNNTLIDSSAVASSVRLETQSLFKQIRLNWIANTPWTNQSQKYPRHLIYRGDQGTAPNQMTLIDSVNVSSGRFTYLDSGQYNKTPLVNSKVYCYRVMTRGSYGNIKVKEPLNNFSEIICAQPDDKTPPCQQVLSIKGTPCDQFIANQACGQNVYSNTVSWKKPTDQTCRDDIKSYNVYVATQVGADFLLYAENVRDTFYIDANLPSYARCYKVSAVDRAGNESILSEQFCFDNCPNYELPNVFTPNGDNCNELFSAYGKDVAVDENGNGPCGPIDVVALRAKCARFVESVTFTVNNRWGKEVYTYQSGGERTIYIDWDGKDNNGKDLAAGVYYYNARVTFTVVDPSKKTKDIHGWVQIIR
jgi:hypothetical protein